jgi:hypothetical protein
MQTTPHFAEINADIKEKWTINFNSRRRMRRGNPIIEQTQGENPKPS